MAATCQSHSLSYQWYKNGSAISTQTNATLRINSARLSDAGSYHVTARCFGHTATSNTATVDVSEPEVPPSITSQPVSMERVAGDQARFSVTAKGLSPLQFIILTIALVNLLIILLALHLASFGSLV